MNPDHGTDCAEFFRKVLRHEDREDIRLRDWDIVETNCRRAYEAVRALLVRKDYVTAAKLILPMYRHRQKLPERLVNVFNFVSQEIYNPGWIKTLEEKSHSE